MPRILTLRSKDESNREVISLVLSQDAVSIGPDGDPWCGLTLNSEQARLLAEWLTSLVKEIENREEKGFRTYSQSFVHLSAVVVVHDGSQCGHRAYEAASHLARRSFASLELIGIYGTADATGEPSLSGE